MSKLQITLENPEYVRPLILRIASDDGKIDKYAGITDWTDLKQLNKLFKSWREVIREVNLYEETHPEPHAEPLSEVIGLPWDRHKRQPYER